MEKIDFKDYYEEVVQHMSLLGDNTHPTRADVHEDYINGLTPQESAMLFYDFWHTHHPEHWRPEWDGMEAIRKGLLESGLIVAP